MKKTSASTTPMITATKTPMALAAGRCAFGEEDGHFFDCIQGWVRVMVINNTLWATHFGEGFGTRDGVFLVAMLEILAKHRVPDVDFLLQPGDRAKVLKPKHPLDTKVLPLFLSFATHPDYLEVTRADDAALLFFFACSAGAGTCRDISASAMHGTHSLFRWAFY